MLLTQPRKENVGPIATPIANVVFRVLLFLPHVGVDGSKEESHNPCNCTSHEVTDALQDIGTQQNTGFLKPQD